jgi:hypothetical protein
MQRFFQKIHDGQLHTIIPHSLRDSLIVRFFSFWDSFQNTSTTPEKFSWKASQLPFYENYSRLFDQRKHRPRNPRFSPEKTCAVSHKGTQL